jgi:hypothetical protein
VGSVTRIERLSALFDRTLASADKHPLASVAGAFVIDTQSFATNVKAGPLRLLGALSFDCCPSVKALTLLFDKNIYDAIFEVVS